MGQGFKMRPKAGVKNAAEIYIYEDVGFSWFGGVTAKDFADQLRALGDVSQIDVRINSYGGDVFDGLAIYNQLQTHKASVTTYIDGIAASIASIIAMAGDEIHIAEAGFVMIHDAWGVAIGDAGEIRAFAERLDAITGALGDVYVSRTGKTSGEVRDWMRAETWFNSADALKNGFATKVVENQKMAAHGMSRPKFDSTRYRFKRPPKNIAARPDYEAAAARLAAQRSGYVQKSLKRAPAA